VYAKQKENVYKLRLKTLLRVALGCFQLTRISVLLSSLKNMTNKSVAINAQGLASECPDVKNYKWRLNLVCNRIRYTCTHLATVGIKGLKTKKWNRYKAFMHLYCCICCWVYCNYKKNMENLYFASVLFNSLLIFIVFKCYVFCCLHFVYLIKNVINVRFCRTKQCIYIAVIYNRYSILILRCLMSCLSVAHTLCLICTHWMVTMAWL